MRLIVLASFIVFSLPSFCQEIIAMVLHGDTLWVKNYTTNDSIQLNRTVPNQAGQAGKFLSTNGTAFLWDVPPAGGAVEWASVLNKPATFAPSSHGHTYGEITGTPPTLSLTTSGTSGAATLNAGVLNVPNYATSGPTRTFLPSDVINNNATANTIADVTGLSFAVTANTTYSFRFWIVYSAAATTTGSRWSINGPAATFMNYYSNYTLTATSITNNQGLSAYNTPSGVSASSLTTNNICVIEGVIRPSANGTVIARFASEISSSAITAVASGRSYVEYQIIN